MVKILFLVIFAFSFRLSAFRKHCNSDNDRVFVYPSDYKKNDAPVLNLTAGQEPLIIQIAMDIWSISEVSLIKQDIEVDIIITVYWYDHRLKVNANLSLDSPWIRLEEETLSVWRPTLLFLNCKGCLPLSLGNSLPLFVGRKTGQFWAQQRILTKFGCAIDLRAYPMDIQNCVVQLYTNERDIAAMLLQHWSPDARIHPSSGITLPEFFIPSIEKGAYSVTLATGNSFSCIELRIKFIRLIANQLTTSYAPTTFIVILSWISFWLPINAVPARTALGLTSLLTLATHLDQAQRNLPPVSYVKAIDVWMFACIFLVSVSLLEFAVANYWHRQAKAANEKTKINNIVKVKPLQENKENAHHLSCPMNSMPSKELDDTFLDKTSRIIFPIFFIVFNIVYWSYYVSYYN